MSMKVMLAWYKKVGDETLTFDWKLKKRDIYIIKLFFQFSFPSLVLHFVTVYVTLVLLVY